MNDEDLPAQFRSDGSFQRFVGLHLRHGAVVADGSVQHAGVVMAVAGRVEMVVDQRVGAGMQRQIVRLAAFARDPKMRDAVARVAEVPDLRLDRLSVRCRQQLARLVIAGAGVAVAHPPVLQGDLLDTSGRADRHQPADCQAHGSRPVAARDARASARRDRRDGRVLYRRQPAKRR